MPRYTKAQAANHQRAADLVHSDKTLNMQERAFVIENWLPGRDQSAHAAFFTPPDWAGAITVNVQCSTPARYVDLGAGIGTLTFDLWRHMQFDRSTRNASAFHCIEESAEFVEVGRRVMPEATWHQGSVFDPALWAQIGTVDIALCNPPFGNYGTKPPHAFPFQNAPRHMQFVAVAVEHTTCGGAFILPSPDLPFVYDLKLDNPRHRYKSPDTYSAPLARLLGQYPGVQLACLPWQLSANFDGAAPAVNLADVNLDEYAR